MQQAATPEIGGAPTLKESQTFCLIVFPQSAEEQLIALLDQVGVPGYTRSEKVTGRGPRGAHFDNPIWPGSDRIIFTVVNQQHAEALGTAIAYFRGRLDASSKGLCGVRMFSWSCNQVS